MYQLFEYYGRWQGLKGRMSQLPSWARLLIGLAAIPGIVCLALSILAILVSLLALLVLTVPLYRFLCKVCRVEPGTVVPAGTGGFGPPPEGMDVVVEEQPGATTVVVDDEPAGDAPRPTRRQIDVKIVE